MSKALFATILLITTMERICKAETEVADVPGDVYIGGLFDIGFPNIQPSDLCETDKIDILSVMELEAVKWAIQRLNNKHYIPGLKLGLRAYKTCQLPSLASLRAKDLIDLQQQVQTADLHKENGERNITKIVGIIGPTFSSESETVSRMISSFPSKYHIPQVSYSSTASFLNEHSTFKNFYRTIPSDDLQLTTMRQLILSLQWNYITIVHSNDRYGKDATDRIRQMITHDGVCIRSVLKYSHSPNYQVNLNELKDIVRNITISAVKGVIFIGGSQAASNFMYVVDHEHQFLSDVPDFIFSEAVGLQQQVFMDVQNARVRPASKGALVLSPPTVNIKGFQNHWESIFTNETKLNEECVTNPWLLNVSRELESQLGKSKTLQKSDLSRFYISYQNHCFVAYAIKATYALAKNVKEIFQRQCQNADIEECILKIKLTTSDVLLENLHRIRVDFSRDFGEADISELYSSSVLSFTETGDVKAETDGISQYQVYNHRKCHGDEHFCFVKVGDLKNNKLEMDTPKLKGYSISGKELQHYRAANCPRGHKCSTCLPSHNMERSLYIDGDLIIVVTFPIHDMGSSPMECGDIRSDIGLDVALGAEFAIAKVNERKGGYRNTFPNTTIGLLLLDSCNDPMVITEKILNLHLTGTVPGAPENIISRVIGYVGDLGSSTTAAIAEITTQFKFVQIACCATASVLSDASAFPYFARLSTPVDKTVKVMLKILQDIGANYIQVLYSGSKYGESGRDALKQYSQSYNVCVAQYKEVHEGSSYNVILEHLLNFPSARVVIVFIRSHVVHKVLEAITTDMRIGEFHFIGSEGWGTRDNMLKLPKLVGSISIAEEITLSDEYKTFLYNLKPSLNNKNYWLMPFMQKRLGCYFEYSFDKSLGRPCGPNDRLLGNMEERLDLWTPYFINSVYALLQGAYNALFHLCGLEQTLCSAYKTNPAEVFKSIKNTKLDVSGYGRNVPVFDENGDGLFGLKIYNMQRNQADSSKLYYKKVGEWSQDGIYQFNRNHLVFPGGQNVSACDESIQCKPCAGKKQQQDGVQESPVDPGNSIGAQTIVTIVLAILLFSILVTFLFICRRYTSLKTYKMSSYRSSDIKSEAYNSIHDVGHLSHINSEVSLGTPHSKRHDTTSSIGTPTTERIHRGTPPVHHIHSLTNLNAQRFNIDVPVSTPKNTRRLNSAPLPAIPVNENRSNSSPYILATVAANSRLSEPTLGTANVSYILRRHALSSAQDDQSDSENFLDNGYILPVSDPISGTIGKVNKGVQSTENVNFTVGEFSPK